MVFAVNPQDGQFDTFKAAAIQQNGTSATNSSTSVTPKACASTDDSGSSLVSESGLVGGLFTCVYQSAGTCQYFTVSTETKQIWLTPLTHPSASVPRTVHSRLVQARVLTRFLANKA